MLSFQKLRVDQRSIELLALVLEIIGQLPKAHAELADLRVDVNVQVLVHVQVVVNVNVNAFF